MITVTPWPPSPIDLVSVQTGALCLADIIHNLAGVNAALEGHLVGGDVLADGVTPNPAPAAAATGLPGHDHSGGVYGKPFGVSLFTLDSDSGALDGGITSNAVVAEGIINHAVATAADDLVVDIGSRVVWIPGCDHREGAYNQLGVSGTVHISTTIGAVLGELYLRIVNRHPDLGDVSRDWQIPTITSTGEKRFVSTASAGAPLLPVVAGAFNPLSLQLFLDATGSAGTRQIACELLALEGGVYQV